MWFDDDEADDGDHMPELLKSKLDADFDQINKYIESKRGSYSQCSIHYSAASVSYSFACLVNIIIMHTIQTL